MPEANSSPYAHNLVSSLYAVTELLETFLNGHEGCLGKKQAKSQSRDVLERAHDQAQEALQIAKRLSDVLAVKEVKKIDSVGLKSSVKEAWRKALRLLKNDFSLDEMETLERIPEPFPLIQCHPADLEEAFYHLMKNAMQAMKGEGKLIIRAQVSFSTKEESFATVHLADSGPGISESTLSRLFLPFYTTKPWQKGNGLGLFLTRQLVLRNHGRITVSSAPGFGTTFTLEFPLAQ